MSDRLFSPTYRIPGVAYSDNPNEDIGRSSFFFQHLQQTRRTPRGANMSVRPAENNGGKTLNPNSYATRKTVAQGMLDIALLTANASQLRYVLSLGERHENYELMVGLIVTSLVLQILVGILFLIIGALNINKIEQQRAANILNNIITLMLFAITLINVVLNSFGLNHDANRLYDKAR